MSLQSPSAAAGAAGDVAPAGEAAPPPNPASVPPPKPVPEPVGPLRFAALIVLVLLVNAWIVAHTDLDAAIGAIIEVVVAVVAAAAEFGPKRYVHRFGRQVLWRLTQREVLIPAYAIFLIGGSVISSVAVYSAGAGEIGSVKVGSEGSKRFTEEKLTAADPDAHFYRFTNPFGRPLYLEVRGYARHSFDLYPWFPRRIRVARDLALSPSLLIRVPDHVFALATGASIELQGCPAVAVSDREASVLFGEPRPIPDPLLAAFNRELAAEQEPADTTAKRIEAWLAALPARPPFSITPGMRLRARLVGPDGGEIASREFIVGEEPIQDIRLLTRK